jgi:hypothetical protein
MDRRAAEQTAAINATQDPALAALRRHGTLPFGDAGVEMNLNAMNHGGHGEHGARA